MQHLRIGIAKISHEGNSFSCAETSLDDFRATGAVFLGQEMLDHPENRDEVAGFIHTLECADEDAKLVPLLSIWGCPSGNVAKDTVEYIETELRARLRSAEKLDAVLFALHGAMTSTAVADLDGYFLSIVCQEVGAEIPVVCTLDCHAVVTEKMVDLSTAIVAYRTHPHVDIFETGKRGADILLRILRKEISPVTAWQKIPMLVPPPDNGTKSGPMKELFDTLSSWDHMDGVVACSLCPAQPWMDVPEQGWTALAVTDNDPGLARSLVRQLLEKAWSVRENLLPEEMLEPDAAVFTAAASPGCPIVITDSADTVGSGARGDTTGLLEAVMKHRGQVDGLILISLPDPDAVSAAARAGVGADVTMEIGGKRDTKFSSPLRVTGQVSCVTDGIIEDVGRFGTTPFMDVGMIACVAVDNVRVVLTDQVVLGPQPSLFRKVGIEPFDAKIVALKTGVGFKVTYGQVAKAVIRADCPGATSYNLGSFDFKHVPRPLYPLDRNMKWQGEI